MNEYTKHIIRRFHKSYVNRTFDQDEVTLFLISSRDFSEPNSPLREIGDFIAHPKLRNRGLTLSSVERTTPEFEKMLMAAYSNADSREDRRLTFEAMPVFHGLGTQAETFRNIARIFDAAEITEHPHENSDNFRELLFCIIFLLSQFAVRFRGEKLEFSVEYSRNLSLMTKVESSFFPRHYANLPIITLHGCWPKCPGLATPQKKALRNHIARRFKNGMLAAVPYELDLHPGLQEVSNFSGTAIWPYHGATLRPLAEEVGAE